LQYLEKPWSNLQQMIEVGAEYLIFDRIAFHDGKTDRLTVQKVPEWIYSATYPCWFLNEPTFLQAFHGKYELVYQFINLDIADVPSYFKGFVFKKV
jgi:putative methyltransferase (TIGR04325 family)